MPGAGMEVLVPQTPTTGGFCSEMMLAATRTQWKLGREISSSVCLISSVGK